MRVHFSELFSTDGGVIQPRARVRVGGVEMGPGVSFGGGVSMGGVNLAEHVGKYLEVEQQGDVYVITGVYG